MINRTAMITGASRGIGRACALGLARSGARVVLAARSLDKLEEVAAEVRAAGGTAKSVVVDMSSRDSILAGVAEAQKEFGTIHILVNNAAITKDGLALRMKPEDWDSVIQTNLTGAFTAMQAVMQGMIKERWGRMINISSVVGEMGNAGQANYVASKAGLIGLTKALAREIASRNITVNAIAPGFIDTDMTAVLSEEVKMKMLEQIPLKRPGSDLDVAYAVAFLASDEAGYVTGQVINVNGGMYM